MILSTGLYITLASWASEYDCVLLILPLSIITGVAAWFGVKHPNVQLSAIVLIITVSLYYVATSTEIRYMFDMGPYECYQYKGSVVGLHPEDSLAYRGGQLTTYHQTESTPPLVVFMKDDEVVWISAIPSGLHWDDPANVTGVVSMEAHEGFWRDDIDFFALGWSEPGGMIVSEYKGVIQYYLSPF